VHQNWENMHADVNASVLLRPDNFDRPFLLFLLAVDHLQGSLVFVLHEASIGVPTPPCGRSPPPGPSVVDGSCRDERTRDTPQSLPRSLVSSAKPTTGVQVVRPAAPHGLDSLTPDAHRARPPHPRRHECASSQRQRGSRQGKIPQRRLCLRQADIDPPFIFAPLSLGVPADLSCGNWGR
jgi:hypothetical protein